MNTSKASLESHPYGFWKCTRSKFPEFKVGEVYECTRDLTGEPRIYPSEGSNWAPYWSASYRRFYYPREDLDFEYIGEFLVEEDKEDSKRYPYTPFSGSVWAPRHWLDYGQGLGYPLENLDYKPGQTFEYPPDAIPGCPVYCPPEEEEEHRQVGGDHYKKYEIEPVEFIVKNNIPYREANVIKYVVRHQDKNGKQDIEKAIHYLQMILEDYE